MAKTIEVTVFGKRTATADGKRYFTRYFGRLPGREDNVAIKFTKEAGEPEDVPVVLVLQRGGCNLSTERYTNKDGETLARPVLWISAWSLAAHGVDDGMGEFFED